MVILIVILNLTLKVGLLTIKHSQWLKVFADNPDEPGNPHPGKWKVIPKLFDLYSHGLPYKNVHKLMYEHIWPHTCTHIL